jgi:small subunit ribosomal protein S17
MPNNRKRLIGRVISDKMDKTVTVAIERRRMHPLYKKVVSSTKKVKAHDETNTVPLGALVQIVESKPLSKTKRWVVEKVLEGTTEAEQAVLQEELSQRHEEETDNDSE